MAMLFADHFWGDKHTGFDILCQNLKASEQSCKDLEDFVKQCNSTEEQYVKSLGRLIKYVSSYNSTTGSFAPVWQKVKSSLEKLSAAHADLSKNWQDLMKDVHKYTEGLTKKHKSSKDAQSQTLETVQSMQHITTALHKSKESYTSKFNDYKKSLSDKTTAKKVERADQEFKKATEEYKGNVAKYNSTRENFITKMTESSNTFQEVENEHLTQMGLFLKTYASLREEKHIEIGELHFEFHSSLSDLSPDKLLEQFIEHRGTGTDPPAPVEFEEADLASLPPPPSPLEDSGENGSMSEVTTPTSGSGGGGGSSMMHLNITKIFRKDKSKRNKDKKKVVENGKDSDSTKDGESSEAMDKVSTTSSQPEVDEEGYIIRKDGGKKEEDSWDSSSDSDGEDQRPSKLKVEIKPLSKPTEGSPGPSFADISLKLPNSTSQSSNADKRNDSISSDLMDLASPTGAMGGGRGSINATPIQWGIVPINESEALTAEDKEVFDAWHTNTSRNSTGNSAAIPGLPRPPSRKDITSGRLSAGRYSPGNLMQRQESFGAQNVRTFNTSPSNLDSVPVAVAITEIIQAQFRGAEHTTQVQGEIMMSFPVSMIKVLENPSAPSLTFKIAGRSEDQVKVNSELINCADQVYSVIGDTLLRTLKAKQSGNAGASYFNLCMAKYTLTTTLLPLQINTYWKCDPQQTDFRLDYQYEGSALHKPLPLTNLTFLVPINGSVSSVQSVPSGTWNEEQSKILWKIEELKSGSDAKGSLKARFILQDGPGSPNVVGAQFTCEGTILSGTDLELTSKHYRISLAKKRMCAKYLINTDKLVTYV